MGKIIIMTDSASDISEKEEKELAVDRKPKMDAFGMLSLEDDDDEKMDVEETKEVTVRPLMMKDFEKASKEVGERGESEG